MNNKHLSWNKEINSNFIIASRAYFLQVYDQVEVAAKYSQQDCKLDRLLDGVEEEVFESKWLCTFLDICNSSWIV